jgi:hypothetical protein
VLSLNRSTGDCGAARGCGKSANPRRDKMAGRGLRRSRGPVRMDYDMGNGYDAADGER